jgi:hypothetical protein
MGAHVTRIGEVKIAFKMCWKILKETMWMEG